MIAAFCLRLAAGLVASMLLLPFAETPPRFFRVHFLSAMGLLAVAGFFLMGSMHLWLAIALGASLLCCFAGSVAWHIDGAPLARPIVLLATAGLLSALCLADRWEVFHLADALTSAAFLGSCTSAMLMGHSYLIAPAMSLVPLMRLLGAMGVTLVLRVILAGIGLIQWRETSTTGLDTEIVLWLGLRWGLGFVGVLVLGWMSWESARIRSTQSATGILYVVVIFCFLGELCGQLLTMKTGIVL